MKSPVGQMFHQFFGENMLRADVCNAVEELGQLLDHTGPVAASERTGSVKMTLTKGAMRVSSCGGPNHSGCPFCRVVNRGEEYECNYFTAGRFPSRDDVGMAYKSGTRPKDCPMPERGILVRPS